MNDNRNRVCPVELAGSLDNRLRIWIQNPRKILAPYIKEGMTVLDIGCGPGFFSLVIADMVGKNGKVIAADMQEGMLQKIKQKITGTVLEDRIKLHKSEQFKIGVSEKVDFILAFYMIHEVPEKEMFFKELISTLKDKGQFLIVEPKYFHVSKKDFEVTISKAKSAGFQLVDKPKLLMSQVALLINSKS
jgi:ubiquinone/menaquinone biosynthesis C-methylase UbiE